LCEDGNGGVIDGREGIERRLNRSKTALHKVVEMRRHKKQFLLSGLMTEIVTIIIMPKRRERETERETDRQKERQTER
jgi:hypothetical protein